MLNYLCSQQKYDMDKKKPGPKKTQKVHSKFKKYTNMQNNLS